MTIEPPGDGDPPGDGEVPRAGDTPRAHPAVLRVIGPLVTGDVPRLCQQAQRLLAELEPGTPVACEVSRLGTPDAVALDALARLQLTARRMGSEVALRGASPQLRAVLRASGLCEAVPIAPPDPASDVAELDAGDPDGRRPN